MEIRLSFKDEKEFHTFMDALNNSYLALNQVRRKIELGCNDSTLWDTLDNDIGIQRLKDRCDLLYDKYIELLKEEKSIKT